MFKSKKSKWAAALIALVALVVAFLIWQTPSANAYKDNNITHRVSQGEFFSLKADMPRNEVERILDGPGHDGTQPNTRWYRWAYGSVKFVRVVIVYNDNKMENAFLVAKKANNGTFDVPILGVDYRIEETQDGCITHKEWTNAKRSNMSGLERVLGVRGAGKVVVSQDNRQHLVKQYPWCGRTEDEGFYQISYDKNKAGLYMANYINEFDFR